ncbi:hypothetical protein F4778DRAFT_777336 [Xylariomycetidae sp. FL2044]|nr:hypothetical protein F4778DRAFT_777336 [Xylariomycetidae sp. FL2044]
MPPSTQAEEELNHDRAQENNLHTFLKKSQASDVTLSLSIVQEIKHRLKYSPSCRHVRVEDTVPSNEALADLSSTFLGSQLHWQKLTDVVFCSKQVAAALVVIFAHLSQDPDKSVTFPTLFHFGKTRHFLLLAYLTCEMESRTYSILELLELRNAQSPRTLVEKLQANKEIGDILKSKSALPPTQARRLKKTKEDMSSSAESDEVIFQGKKKNRQDQSRQDQPRLENGDFQWKYRGRAGSEVKSDEPLPAPSGVNAQKTEGFQRFFKAVVSPTHVRVTAGGRIVPNTRGSPSPTAKGDKDQLTAEAQEVADAPKENKPVNGPPANASAPPQFMTPVYPGHPGFYPPMGMPMPVPFYPLPNGVPFPYPMPPPQHPQPLPMYPASAQQQQNNSSSSNTTKAEEGTDSQQPSNGPVKVSPPEQFDRNRPFFYNGHMVYPATMGGHVQMAPMYPGHFLPQPMPGHPSFHPAARMPSMMHPRLAPMPQVHPRAASMPGSGAPMGPGGPVPGPFVPTANASGNEGPRPRPVPFGPNLELPVTSIKPSMLYKRLAEQLRASQKHFQNQLENNMHQIDVKDTEQKIFELQQDIDKFEANYREQVELEQKHAVQASQPKIAEQNQEEQLSPCDTPSRPRNPKDRRTEERSTSGSMSVCGPAPPINYGQSLEFGAHPKLSRNRHAVGLNASKPNRSTAALDALEKSMMEKRDMAMARAGAADPTKKQSLPSGAALAPPFHPVSISQAFRSSSATFKGESPIFPGGDVSSPWLDAPQTAPPYFGESSFSGGASISSLHPQQQGYRLPYLVGHLPEGMNPFTANDTDYEYARELTDEEKRARHVYWGGVPNKGWGLPKFDGKDFYPASPVKDKKSSPGENDPFQSSRDADSVQSQEVSHKISKAIPIVAPSDTHQSDGPKKSDAGGSISQDNSSAEALINGLKGLNLTSPTQSASLHRRAAERSSNHKTGNDLWQTMLRKKGSTSGNALPGAVSSTTATGYLPQYFGHAAASLGPAVSNTNFSPARTGTIGDSKTADIDAPDVAAEKVGENRPPKVTSPSDFDIAKDLHALTIRDAQKRGVNTEIRPDWQ